MPFPGKKSTNQGTAGKPVWHQGYYPPQPSESPQHNVKPDRRRLSGRRKNRYWLVLLLSGLALSLAGVAITIPVLLSQARRQKAESALQALYYQTAAPETAVLPQASPLPAEVPASAPPQATAPPLRSFATRASWKVNVTRDRFLPLRRINKDVAGWLSINGILDLPVVQRDNIHYLTHDYYGDASPSGALFVDENFSFSPPSENLLIHGHNMRDGSMFGRLFRYADRAFYTDHWLIRFESLYEQSDYAVFAAFSVSGDGADPSYFRYAYSSFPTDAQFTQFIADVRKRSEIRSGLDVLPTDRLIMLSTCLDGSDYFVVIGRRIRDDETHANVRLACVLTAYR